jgi:hypothetical protein
MATLTHSLLAPKLRHDFSAVIAVVVGILFKFNGSFMAD